MRLNELKQLRTVDSAATLLVLTDALVYDDTHIQINKILRINCIKEIRDKREGKILGALLDMHRD